METMNIALPENLKSFVQQQVEMGGYSSVSEYVRELIRKDQKDKAREALEAEIVKMVRAEIGPIAKPDHIHFTPALPKTRSSHRAPLSAAGVVRVWTPLPKDNPPRSPTTDPARSVPSNQNQR